MNKKVYLRNEKTYIDFAIKCLEDHIFPSVENLENHFGLQFGTDKEVEDGHVNINNMQIVNRDKFPESYPCVMVFLHNKEWDRSGVFTVSYIDYVYKTDFESFEVDE